MGLQIFPAELKDKLATRRATLRGEAFIDILPGDAPPACVIDPLAQVKILGDAYSGGFSTGHTMRNSASMEAFRFERQEARIDGARTTIVTTLNDDRGHRIEHRLSHREGNAALESTMEFFNDSDRPVTLEMLASFSLGGITPFARDDAPGRLRVHRFRTGWAAEGRLETRTIEQLHLERSWAGCAAFSERFGQVGTMPVRKWFPFLAIEDTAAGVTWGAQLAWAGSWQMEVFRQHDEVCISGGIADREFGHWTKTLAPGNRSPRRRRRFRACTALSMICATGSPPCRSARRTRNPPSSRTCRSSSTNSARRGATRSTTSSLPSRTGCVARRCVIS